MIKASNFRKERRFAFVQQKNCNLCVVIVLIVLSDIASMPIQVENWIGPIVMIMN